MRPALKLPPLTILVCFLSVFVSLVFPTSTVLQPDATEGLDTFVNQNSPNQNYGSNTMLAAGESGGQYAGILLKFDLSAIPGYANITSAKLKLYFYDSPTNPTNAINLSTRRITSDWTEGTVTWNTRPSYSAAYSDMVTLTDSYGWVEWDVTNGVQNIVNGTATNYGMAVAPDLASASTDKRFYSSDYSNESLRPMLEINYTTPPPPDITILWPYNDTQHGDGDNYVGYRVSSDKDIDNCSLILNGSVRDTDSAITKDVLQLFKETSNTNRSYQVSINCTDSDGNTGASEVLTVEINTSKADLYGKVEDSDGNALNVTINFIQNGSTEYSSTGKWHAIVLDDGVYDVQIIPVNYAVIEATFRNVNISKGFTKVVDFDELPSSRFKRLYAIDPTSLTFGDGTVVANASTGSAFLYKCLNWSFATETCLDDIWRKVNVTIAPGQEYSFTINSTDPGYAEAEAQSCVAEDESKEGDWDTACDGTYPAACGAGGDLLSCDDGFLETHAYKNSANKVGGVKTETSNSSVIDCGSITSVTVCYEWWSSDAGSTCDISVDNDGDNSWVAVTTACPGTSANPGMTCTNVTALEDWSCTDFFKPLHTNATIKSEIYKLTATTSTAYWDVLFYNVTYALDTAPPAITIQSPTNTSYATDTIDLNYTATDMNLDSCWFYLDGVYNSSLPGCANTTIGPLTEGPHNVTVYANDTVNNTNSSTVYFSTDATPPTVSVQSPQNTSYNTSSVDLNYTVSDNIALDSCWYSLDGGAAVPLASCDNSTLSGLSDGPHNVTVYANDTANNTNSSTVYFSTDANPPSITIQSPTNTTYATNTLDLNYTATDMNLDSCWFYLDGVYNSSLPGCANTTIGPLTEGPHNVTVYANDTLNNTDSSTVGFTIALPSDDDGEGKKKMQLSYSFVCRGDEVLFGTTQRNEPLSGVSIRIFYDEPQSFYLVDVLRTNSDGLAGITLSKNGTYMAKAQKSGYTTEEVRFYFVTCQVAGCDSDDACADDERCVDGECVPVECPCGVVKNHQCIEHECCANADCPNGQLCRNHECQEAPPEVECETDEGCAGDERCFEGSCGPVTGTCGYAAKNVWVEYECGDEPECPQCPQGTACVDNRCLRNSIIGPDKVSVKGNATLTAMENGDACANCLVEITDPTGKKTVMRTDDEGKFVLMFDAAGEYKIAVIRNGEPVATKTVNAWAEPSAPEAEAVWWPWLVLILVIILLLVCLGKRLRKR